MKDVLRLYSWSDLICSVEGFSFVFVAMIISVEDEEGKGEWERI